MFFLLVLMQTVLLILNYQEGFVIGTIGAEMRTTYKSLVHRSLAIFWSWMSSIPQPQHIMDLLVIYDLKQSRLRKKPE